ncbi:Strictosidine synthase 3 [Apostasia shenzhenica]|uniref:Strictosidine synthase 3 n=1 Tax=Apostasia shenzhenica TaxID=1088818 RepID=A0A2I0A6U0_9ASPA|nr:Strictosidine synthase 3 [Apostasia shenzhenica]
MAVLAVFLAGIFILLAIYCATDPLGHGPMTKFPGFEVYHAELPAWSELPTVRDSENRLQRAELRFLNQIQGPESIAFDPLGRGPYTGVADGRVLFWNGESWSDFAYTSPNRSEICNPKASPLSYLENEHICGRPLGLRFSKKTGDLYIADAYFGLLKVGPEGGLATPLTWEAEGIPFRFTNDLDIDEEGNIYFTDSSYNYQRRNFIQLAFTAEPSGRLLKYNPTTNETMVLLQDLQFPNGVSMSKDGSFIVFAELSRARFSIQIWSLSIILFLLIFSNFPPQCRLFRYWLKGEKAGKSEVFAVLPGIPDNVRANEEGDFWVAIHCRVSMYAYFLGKNPSLSKLLLKLPIPAKFHFLMLVGGRLHAVIAKYSPDGKLLDLLEDQQGKVVKAVSEVEEKDGKLWIGSVLMPFIAVYPLN